MLVEPDRTERPPISPLQLSVVIPAYNERPTIEDLLQRVIDGAWSVVPVLVEELLERDERLLAAPATTEDLRLEQRDLRQVRVVAARLVPRPLEPCERSDESARVAQRAWTE